MKHNFKNKNHTKRTKNVFIFFCKPDCTQIILTLYKRVRVYLEAGFPNFESLNGEPHQDFGYFRFFSDKIRKNNNKNKMVIIS